MKVNVRIKLHGEKVLITSANGELVLLDPATGEPGFGVFSWKTVRTFSNETSASNFATAMGWNILKNTHEPA